MNAQEIAAERAGPVLTVPAVSPARPAAKTASEDAIISSEVLAGFGAWRIWTLLAWDDIRQRYRRSVLGPFWITLSMGIFIISLGLIYSELFHQDLKSYLPFLAAGLIVWGFIAAVANEGCTAFENSDDLIKQIKLPYSVYVLRIVYRNFIIFLHNIAILIPIALIFDGLPTLATLYALPGLFLVIVNVTWVAMLLAVLSTRYRDVTPIVATIVQLMMFITPIMYPAASLGNARIVAEINPVYHMIELVRAPILGIAPDPLSWLVCGGVALIGSALACALLVSTSRRIVFWL
jgi:ABC-type polysaccharide/polyol phosphate export permease